VVLFNAAYEAAEEILVDLARKLARQAKEKVLYYKDDLPTLRNSFVDS